MHFNRWQVSNRIFFNSHILSSSWSTQTTSHLVNSGPGASQGWGLHPDTSSPPSWTMERFNPWKILYWATVPPHRGHSSCAPPPPTDGKRRCSALNSTEHKKTQWGWEFSQDLAFFLLYSCPKQGTVPSGLQPLAWWQQMLWDSTTLLGLEEEFLLGNYAQQKQSAESALSVTVLKGCQPLLGHLVHKARYNKKNLETI